MLRTTRTSGRLPVVLLAGLGGILLALGAYRISAAADQDRLRTQFDRYLAEQAFALEKEVLALGEVLYSLKALFEASDEVTRSEFRTFARGPLSRLPAVRAMEWIPFVRSEARLAHVAMAREKGLDAYDIVERTTDGHLVPAAQRSAYYPVRYIEPRVRNEEAFGFDLGSERVRRAALVGAVAHGEPTLTDPVVLVQDRDGEKSVLYAHAVFESGERLAPDANAHLLGFVLLVVRVPELLGQSQICCTPGSSARMEFELSDADVDGSGMPLYTSSQFGEPSPVTASKGLVLGSQTWRLRGQPTAAFLAERRSRQPLFAALLALGAWLGLAGLLFVLSRRSEDEARRRQTGTIRSVLASLTDGVIVADSSGEFLVVNDSAERILGLGADYARPGAWSRSFGCLRPDGITPIPEDELPLVRALGGEVVQDEEIYLKNHGLPDGAWISVNATPLRSTDGRLQGGVSVFRDVTVRKRADETVKRLSSAVEQTADAVLITDRDGIIQYVNPAFETITGYAREEVRGRTPRMLKSGRHPPAYYAKLWATILDGEVFRSTFVNRRKDGRLYYAEQTITPLKDDRDKVTHFVSVSKDMTERRRIQEQEIEMQIAAEVQRRLYPQRPPRLEEFDVAGAVYSAEATSGDYFDFLELPDGSLGLVIGDVSGHGLGPALVMAQARAWLRSLTGSGLPLDQVFRRLNETLAADLQDDMFLTLLVVSLDPRTRRLCYANAGHTPGYILGADGSLRAQLELTGIPLGIAEDSAYGCSADLVLDPGDVLVLLTDGVTESRAPDGSFLLEGALDLVRERLDAPAEEIVRHLHRGIQGFTAGRPQHDDVTMVVCKAAPRPAVVHSDGTRVGRVTVAERFPPDLDELSPSR